MTKARKSAVDYLRRRYVGSDEAARADLDAALLSAAVARQIYDLRHSAGLTQRQLAAAVGTSHTVISRLENDDYQGHSLTMLRRIAAALDHRVELRFVRRTAKRA